MKSAASKSRNTPTIRRQIISGNLLIGMMLVLAMIIVFWQVDRLSQAVHNFQVASARAKTAFEIRQNSAQLIATVSRLLPSEDEAAFETEVSGELAALDASNQELANLAKQTNQSDPAYSVMQKASTSIGNVVTLANSMISQVKSGQWPSARVRMGILVRDQQQLSNDTGQLVDLTSQIERSTLDEVDRARKAVILWPTLFVVLAILSGLGLTVQTVQNIARPVERLTVGVSQVAAGLLSERVAVDRQDEFGQLAIAFNQMAGRLQTAHTELEQRVADRTQDLERRTEQLRVASEIARDITLTNELGELLNQAVNLIRERFGFYHAGIFLVDDRGEFAILRAATGEAGRKLLAQEHKLKVGEVGIVGYATGTGKPRIALNVGADATHFKNPLLPDTRSEMALPLRIGDQITGALDVQSVEEAAFDEEDVTILQTMADQLAVAIENARLIQKLNQAVEELERAYGSFTRESWRTFAHKDRLGRGYRYQHLDIQPLAEQSEEARQAFEQGRTVLFSGSGKVHESNQESGKSLAVPLKIRGQVIGVLNFRFRTDEIPEDTIILIEEAASRLALILENARLLQEARRLALREKQINAITAQVSSSVHIESILQNAVRELGIALGASRTYIQINREQDSIFPQTQGSSTGSSPAD